MIRTTIIGAAGRMGRLLVAKVLADPELELAAALEVRGAPAVGRDAGDVAGAGACGIRITDDLTAALADTDAVIDFSTPESTMTVAPAACAQGCAAVIGTTGLSNDDRDALASLAEAGARLMVAPNMSVGVNLLFKLCSEIVPVLGPDYDIEIVEMHHNRKKDAPSGTAVRLGRILAQAAGLDYDEAAQHGRQGNVGTRTRQEIGMHAVRGGDVAGDHTVIFATDGERVELTHRASTRDTFAKGAVRALKFLVAAEPGLYDMQDVLGLRGRP